MRHAWWLILLVWLWPLGLGAEPLTFAWDAPTTYTDASALTVSYYTIRWGTTTGVYTTGTNAPGNVSQYTVQGLDPSATYFFVIIACDASGACSAPSNERSGRATLKPGLSP